MVCNSGIILSLFSNCQMFNVNIWSVCSLCIVEENWNRNDMVEFKNLILFDDWDFEFYLYLILSSHQACSYFS
jgi:hypothetical protein